MIVVTTEAVAKTATIKTIPSMTTTKVFKQSSTTTIKRATKTKCITETAMVNHQGGIIEHACLRCFLQPYALCHSP